MARSLLVPLTSPLPPMINPSPSQRPPLHPPPICECNPPGAARLRVNERSNKNAGRRFWMCGNDTVKSQCDFFKWEPDLAPEPRQLPETLIDWGGRDTPTSVHSESSQDSPPPQVPTKPCTGAPGFQSKLECGRFNPNRFVCQPASGKVDSKGDPSFRPHAVNVRVADFLKSLAKVCLCLCVGRVVYIDF